MELVYDHRGLPGVTTDRPRVAGCYNDNLIKLIQIHFSLIQNTYMT
jgi:hypothetical protein